jgi:hypothetical protein
MCDACPSSLVDFQREDGIGLCKHCFYSGATIYCKKCKRKEGKIRGTDIFNGGIFCDECWVIFQEERKEYMKTRKPSLSASIKKSKEKQRYVYDDTGKCKETVDIVKVIATFEHWEFVLLANGSVGIVNLTIDSLTSEVFRFYLVGTR